MCLEIGDLVKYKPEMVKGVPVIVGIVLSMLDPHYVDVCFTWEGKQYTKQVNRRDLKVISSSRR